MSQIQTQFIKNVLAGTETQLSEKGSAFAPANIALSKYWGKRNAELNLPATSSLSVSLGDLGTKTEIRVAAEDSVFLNGEAMGSETLFYKRTVDFLKLFPMVGAHFEVRTQNSIPTAAGLASSASGFAALVLALNDLAGWGLGRRMLSLIARLGSGSAARSVYSGFVQWYAGTDDDGSDSYAERIDAEWPELRVGILEVSNVHKPVGSREGMNRTVATSELYNSWPAQADADLEAIRLSIREKDFPMLGKTAEHNALSMHATMLAAWPPLIYLQPESLEIIHTVQRLRGEGLELFLTIDAGPNIKLLFLESVASDVIAAFPDLRIIQPFG
ncbi:diphosphomevalonate decarboxylase [Pontiella agarivorans]|uniref:diphosphomevalonate decarboxylase n=1 Tax=Pontiella agarivorans TaxID=3038953 RepID=A0ABU5N090_9BACT|nr:diphosphomevalonate decarboxylase [Pontiella agarivorans]MDZ8119874.1 diphosphomevalonate decarboxylase [Pontiella agarivorans]